MRHSTNNQTKDELLAEAKKLSDTDLEELRNEINYELDKRAQYYMKNGLNFLDSTSAKPNKTIN